MILDGSSIVGIKMKYDVVKSRYRFVRSFGNSLIGNRAFHMASEITNIVRNPLLCIWGTFGTMIWALQICSMLGIIRPVRQSTAISVIDMTMCILLIPSTIPVMLILLAIPLFLTGYLGNLVLSYVLGYHWLPGDGLMPTADNPVYDWEGRQYVQVPVEVRRRIADTVASHTTDETRGNTPVPEGIPMALLYFLILAYNRPSNRDVRRYAAPCNNELSTSLIENTLLLSIKEYELARAQVLSQIGDDNGTNDDNDTIVKKIDEVLLDRMMKSGSDSSTLSTIEYLRSAKLDD